MLAKLRAVRDQMFIPEPSAKPLQNDSRAPGIFFVLTIVFYIGYMFALEPEWLLSGEMWAEMAVNYYAHAHSTSLVEQLLATDAGYIPALPRFIAFLGSLLKLSAAATPYFYTGSAVLLTGVLVGTFCLKPFRALIPQDILRFLTGLMLLIVADFETRTFINFTYFAAFVIIIVTALALVDDKPDSIPRWAWWIPILTVSKPAVLTTLPALMIVSLVSNVRFRLITIVTLVLSVLQIAQIVISQKSGVMLQSNAQALSFLMKASTACQYFLGLLSRYLLGPAFRLSPVNHILAGLAILSICGWVVYRHRHPVNALIILGLLALLLNMFLNAFALSELWNSDMSQLIYLRIYRHIAVGYVGCILVLLGLLVSVTSKIDVPARNTLIPLVWVVWFVGSGWFKLGMTITKTPPFPLLFSSQWQSNAARIDADADIQCIPLNPLGWLYLKNCIPLNPELNLIQDFHFEVLPLVNQEAVFDVPIDPPAHLLDKNLVSFVVVIRPFLIKSASVRVNALIHLKEGQNVTFKGQQDLTLSGGLIQLTGKDVIPVKNVAAIRLVFDTPVEIAMKTNDPFHTPGIVWMGY